MLVLTGQLPCVQIANVIMPTPEEKAQREAIDAKLDEITRRLAAAVGRSANARGFPLKEA